MTAYDLYDMKFSKNRKFDFGCNDEKFIDGHVIDNVEKYKKTQGTLVWCLLSFRAWKIQG